MMGETSHLGGRHMLFAIVPAGKGDAQYGRGLHSILSIGLIEITTAEQEQSIGMLCLQVIKLFHHGG